MKNEKKEPEINAVSAAAAAAVTYRLDQFEGPLDLLLTLISKNKVEITDIPISIICDQYLAYITEAQNMDMDIAAEFLVMASELMLIKSKMLLPRDEKNEPDPRAELADALLRYQQAKEAAAKMQVLFTKYSARTVKDTDEIAPDKSFVDDQDVTDLCAAVRRIIAANDDKPLERMTFAPMISKPIIPVEVKIVNILSHIRSAPAGKVSLDELLSDSVSKPDMIAIFLGVLELIKKKQILIADCEDDYISLHGTSTQFIINDHPPVSEDDDPDGETDQSAKETLS